MPSHPEGTIHPANRIPPTAAFLLAALMFAVSALVFFLLWNAERHGSGLRIHATISALYDLGGKWLAAGFFLLPGAIFLLVGTLATAKRPRPEDGANDS